MKQSDIRYYYRYYGHLTKVKLMSLMEYRFDIIASCLGTYGYTLMILIFIDVIFRNVNTVAGWNRDEILMLFAMSQFCFYFFYTFFWSIWSQVPDAIRTGDLDKLLLKPISPLFQLVTQEFTLIEAAPSMILPFALTALVWNRLDLHPTLFQVSATAIALLAGAAISVLVQLNLALLSFWVSDTKPLQKSFAELEDLRKYPLAIYPESVRWLVVTLVPIGLVAYAPTYLLVKGWSIVWFALPLATLLFFVLMTMFIWRYGTRAYTSASS